MTDQWEDVPVPRGAFISWGTQPGQQITGTVLDFDPAGGTDFGGNTCPQLALELTEPGYSVNKEGQRSDFPAGEQVVLNCGLVSLKRAVKAANLAPGMLCQITFSNTVKTQNGTVKEFTIRKAPGRPQAAAPAAASASPWGSAPAAAAPPF